MSGRDAHAPDRSGPVDVSESLAAALLDASPDGMLLVDRNGEIGLANPAAAAIFGRAQVDLVGASVESLVPAEQRVRHVAHRERYNAEPVARPMGSGLRLLAEHADGTLFPVEISLSPIELDEVRFIATIRDVSERQADRALMSLHQDRERIARDLHDLVIQGLFATGMSLDAISRQVSPPEVADRLESVTDQLDQTIDEIRRAIFRLGHHDDDLAPGMRLVRTVEDHAALLGFEPELDIDGDVDRISAAVGEHLDATLTESLSNVIRHADASRVEIALTVDDRALRLIVVDDGVGLSGDARPLGGLSNMTWRAEQLGGVCTIESKNSGPGTVLTWSVPLGETPT